MEPRYPETAARPEHSSTSRCSQVPKRSSAQSLLELHWLPVRQRIDYKLAVLTYKIHSTSTPSYPNHHIRSREFAHHLQSSGAPLLYKPTTRTHFVDRDFRCTASNVWNSLAIDITSRLTVFKSKLKTRIFRQTRIGPVTIVSTRATEVF